MSTIYLDRETDRRLAELATATGKPAEAIVREALAAYLEDLEDALAAEAVRARIARGEESTVSLDALALTVGQRGEAYR